MRNYLTKRELSEALKDVEEYAHILDLLGVHTVITDKDANILYANKAAETNTGYTKKEMIGKNPADLWGGNMPEEFFKKMWKTIKKQKKRFSGEIRNIKKDGSEYWQEIHVTPVLDDKGDVKLFISVEVPIQDKKETESKLDLIWKDFVKRENKMLDLKKQIEDLKVHA